MGGFNLPRWLAGGIAAAAVIWLLEGAGSMVYMDTMQEALTAHSLAMPVSSSVMLLSVTVSLLVGLALIFFYAAARPRFGPGPRTAAIVAAVLWLGSYVPALLGYAMVGLYPRHLLLNWGLIGAAELLVAAMVGGWIYRES